MTIKLFIFIVGAFSSLLWSSLPSINIIALMLLICGILAKKSPRVVCFLFGATWMASVGHWQCTLQLPLSDISKPVFVTGKVESLVSDTKNIRFNLIITHLDNRQFSFSRKLRLTWRQPAWPLAQGQIIHLNVKLKPPHGLSNEAGFNYQQWLFSEGIHATGYVKNHENNRLVNSTISQRQSTLNAILGLHINEHKWITALAIGYRGLLEPKDWELVQQTGVAHLIAISGLHLALIASLSYFIFSWLLGLFVSRKLSWHKFNVHSASVLITVFTTYLYSGLAGFGLPTLRAWIMVCLLSSLFILNKKLSAINLLLIAVSGFVVLFPLSLFGASFWLSFSAVLIIWFVFWRWRVTFHGFSIANVIATMLRVQLSLSILMLPVVAWQFSFVSLVSPLVNLVAVPLVTFILVPLCLLAVLCLAFRLSWAEYIFQLAQKIIDYGLYLLSNINQYDMASFSMMSIPIWIWMITLVGLIILCLPRFELDRRWLLLMFLPLLSYFLPNHSTDWKIDILDVGHGLSVFISKNNQVIVYDVGASYPTGFNIADSVLLPVLQARNIQKIAKVFISHSDNDHQGSLPILSSKISIEKIITNQDLCRQGYKEPWQGLSLQVFWPDEPRLLSDNNSSCVIRISDLHHSILLTGDIDKSIERKLVNEYGSDLHSDILVAPHHGSNTSSSKEFIRAVNAKHVVFSQGFMNRWQFPRLKVVTRYRGNTVQAPSLYSTSEFGQVTFNIGFNQDNTLVVTTNRQDTHNYWYQNMPNCCAI